MTPAEMLHNQAVSHRHSGRPDLAEKAFRAALSLTPNPTTEYCLGVLLLSQGRYEEGFALYESRTRVPELGIGKPSLSFTEWNDQSIVGKRILIWPDQGFGDQIQFARFVPILREMGAEVTLLCAPALHRLFSRNLGISVLSASGRVEFPDPDFWVMGCSLGHRLGVRPENIPNGAYLTANAKRSKGRIGVVTRGDPRHVNDANRSLSSVDAAPLLGLPGAISLHPEDTGAADFAATAAIIANLDLVISVDTAVAHLAGAMGKPVWILLPNQAVDWRWGLSENNSPWYPTARLFRNSNSFGSVVDEVVSLATS